MKFVETTVHLIIFAFIFTKKPMSSDRTRFECMNFDLKKSAQYIYSYLATVSNFKRHTHCEVIVVFRHVGTNQISFLEAIVDAVSDICKKFSSVELAPWIAVCSREVSVARWMFFVWTWWLALEPVVRTSWISEENCDTRTPELDKTPEGCSQTFRQ